MPVITVTGLIGSGAIEVGAQVARKLSIDYIDRMIMAEAAKKIGTTVAAVAERTERPPRLGDRVAGFVKTVLERSALAGGGADPYFGGGLDALLVREYRDFPSEESEGDESLSDENLLIVTSAVIKEIASSGNVVIAGRGANIILRDDPGALHVGLVSVHAERLKRIMERENLVDNSAQLGKYLFEQLQTLYEHPIVGEIRAGLGLIGAIELVKDRDTRERFSEEANLKEKLTEAFMERDMFVLHRGDLILLSPPLCITKDEVDLLVRNLNEVVEGLSKELA